MDNSTQDTGATTYGLEATSLALSFAIDHAGTNITKGDSKEVMLKKLEEAIVSINTNIPETKLELVWGPVFDDGKRAVVNSMLVVKNTYDAAAEEYFVAIAGTNPSSLFDWLIEDGFVSRTHAWNDNDASQGRVSEGTEIGLSLLKGMEDNGATVLSFLQGLAAKPTLLHVTGHSLAGALSPVMALFLSENKDSFGSPDFNIYAFAGPTPGDSQFADYYNSQLESVTTRVWNQYDVVPHAWNQTEEPQLSEVPRLYKNIPDPVPNPDQEHYAVDPFLLIRVLVEVAEWLSRNTDFTQPAIATQKPFASEYFANIAGFGSDHLKAFMSQAIYQHIDAYENTLLPPAMRGTAQSNHTDSANLDAMAEQLKQKVEALHAKKAAGES